MKTTIFEKYLRIAVIVLLAAISVTVGAQVFFRFILSNPLPWPEELGRLLFIFLSFLGAGLVSIHNDHISVEIADQFARKIGKYELLEFLRHVAIAVVCIFIMVGGIQVYPRAMRIKLSATGLPKSLMTLAVIIGATVMFIAAIMHAAKSIRLLLARNTEPEDS